MEIEEDTQNDTMAVCYQKEGEWVVSIEGVTKDQKMKLRFIFAGSDQGVSLVYKCGSGYEVTRLSASSKTVSREERDNIVEANYINSYLVSVELLDNRFEKCSPRISTFLTLFYVNYTTERYDNLHPFCVAKFEAAPSAFMPKEQLADNFYLKFTLIPTNSQFESLWGKLEIKFKKSNHKKKHKLIDVDQTAKRVQPFPPSSNQLTLIPNIGKEEGGESVECIIPNLDLFPDSHWRIIWNNCDVGVDQSSQQSLFITSLPGASQAIVTVINGNYICSSIFKYRNSQSEDVALGLIFELQKQIEILKNEQKITNEKLNELSLQRTSWSTEKEFQYNSLTKSAQEIQHRIDELTQKLSEFEEIYNKPIEIDIQLEETTQFPALETLQKHQSKELRTVLVIGALGHGKSTLINFLVNSIPKMNTRWTKNLTAEFPKEEYLEYAGENIVLAEIPALPENPLNDVDYVIKLIKYLIQKESISAVIMCVKLDCQLDAQFNRTISSYSSLLKSCMDINMIVVASNVQRDPYSIEKREYYRRIATQIQSTANLKYLPLIIPIDANPLYTTDNINQQASKTRSILLNTILGMSEVKTTDFIFYRFPEWTAVAQMKLKSLERDLEILRFQQESLLRDMNKCVGNQALWQREITDIIRKMKLLNEELNEKSSDTEQVIQTKQIQSDWSFLLPWASASFFLSCQYPISNIQYIASPDYTWKDVKLDQYTVSGTLVGPIFRSVEGRVVVYTKYKDFYRNKISALQSELNVLNKNLSSLEAMMKELEDTFNLIKKMRLSFDAEEAMLKKEFEIFKFVKSEMSLKEALDLMQEAHPITNKLDMRKKLQTS